ncbi:S66 family peptidase [Staphylococcus canis]|uniref:LD-carboxypeptidase n=1 Tax=Staphylococcus canis TaxID=2724942 RepID=A0ABS0TBQ6_9STAP|nr:S66 peptidase family protein [Staphylococcus canis]MBI5975965.1 LD-carboxypeptidase [Staphylococcus canis]
MDINKFNINSTIGIFSPSWPASSTYPRRYKRGINFLKDKGFFIKEGKLTSKKDNYLSGDLKNRIAELNELIQCCDCIIPTIGGYNSNDLLPYIDYKTIKLKKPIILGFSDTTAIALAIYAKTKVLTFISQALVTSFGEFPPFNEINYKYFHNLLIDKDYKYIDLSPHPYWTEEWSNWEYFDKPKKTLYNSWYFLKKGNATGKLIGGNLDTICSIIGTEYMPKIDNDCILILEDSCKSIDHIHRLFSTLKLHGVFDKINGLILSKFENIDYKSTDVTVEDIAMLFLKNKEIPVLSNFDCGHTHPSILLPLGGTISLNSEDNLCRIYNPFINN